jgi:hypothetical protein
MLVSPGNGELLILIIIITIAFYAKQMSESKLLYKQTSAQAKQGKQMLQEIKRFKF